MSTQNLINIQPYQRARNSMNIDSSIRRAVKTVQFALARKKTIDELQGLSNAQLADIGIPRHAIKDTVNSIMKVARANNDLAKVTKIVENGGFENEAMHKKAA